MAQSDMTDTKGTWGGLIEMPQHQVMQVVLLGIALGAVAWVLGVLVEHIIVRPLFCGDPSNAICTNSVDISNNIAAIIVAFAGLMGLVRLSVYRPLLIALAVLVSLWGMGSWVSGLQWFEAIAWFVVLYTLGYVTFAWLVRPRSFAPTALLIIIALVLIRWLPTV